MFKDMTLGKKLLVSFLAVGVIPFAIIGTISLRNASEALSKQAFNQLQGVREIKKAQIDRFFEERKGDMGVLVETVGTLRKEAFQKLEAIQEIKKAQLQNYFETMKAQLRILKDDPYVWTALAEFNGVYEKAGNKVLTLEWKALAEKYDPRLKDIVKDNGWYDVFLIHTDGDVIYTASREADLGMIIPESELKDSGLGKAFKAAQSISAEDIALADIAPYSPSGNIPAGFMMARMQDGAGVLKGFVAFQIPLDRINEIMLRRDGMGKTGESYLVGQDGLMRSDSFLDPKGHSVAASLKNNAKVDTEATREALAGKENQKVIADYNGNPVLSCWDAVDLGSGVRWAMMTEIDVAEAFSPVDEKGEEFYKKYTALYGYYDLFLINPDGYVFYSAAKESDYQTNMVSGKFSGSNLGQLTKKVLGSKQFGVADFAPYAPSNGEPAAFIAQPVVHDGEVEIVAGLQLSLDAINKIMQQREGMGKTGESYLVGADKLMRSDSFLDPTNHSVKASFANPSKGSVDTEGSREALSGKTGEKIIIDYNGNPVLSAFTPVKVEDATWALIAEIDEAEAFEAAHTLKWLIAVVAVAGLAAIIMVALLITRSITKPVNKIIDGLTAGSDQVTAASQQVSQASQQMAEGASEQASSLEETSSSLEELTAMTKRNAENAREANSQAQVVREATERSREAMERMAGAIAKIKTSSDETAKIVKTIDEIAFQTNLLALNAAVEAARAGEAGKGFAVVAEEVRNLAQRSAGAAKNTAELIEGSQRNSENGVSVSNEVGGILKQIVEGIQKVTQLAGEVSGASEEQAKGIDQINVAVSQMDKVTQSNAANAEESASASEELSAQAVELNDMVKVLISIVGSANGNGNGHKPLKAIGGRERLQLKSGGDLNHGLRNRVHDLLHHGEEGRPFRAKAVAFARHTEVKPDEVIPLGEEDFKEF